MFSFIPKKQKIIIHTILLFLIISSVFYTGITERFGYWYYCQFPKQYQHVSGVVTEFYTLKGVFGSYRTHTAYEKSITISYMKNGQQEFHTFIARKNDKIGSTVSLAVKESGLFQTVRTNLPYSVYEITAIISCLFITPLYIYLLITFQQFDKGKVRLKNLGHIKNEEQYRKKLLNYFPPTENPFSKEELRILNIRCQFMFGCSLPKTIRWFLTHMNLDYFIERGYLFDKQGQSYRFENATATLKSIGITGYLVLKYETDYYLLYHLADGMMYKYDLNEAEVVCLNCNFYEYLLDSSTQ